MNEQVKVDFIASAKGLDEIYKKINEIKKMDGVQIGPGLQKQFSQLDAMIPALQQKLKALGEKENLTLFDVQQVNRDFEQITKGFHRALRELSSSLPQEIAANLEQAKKAIADIDKQIKSSKGKIATREGKLETGADGKATLNQAETNKVFQQQKAPKIKDNEIASFDEYKRKFEELRQAQQLSKQEEEQIRAAIQQTEAAVKQKTSTIQSEISQEQNKIAALQQERAAAVENKHNVEEQIKNNQQLTAQQQQLTNAIVGASNQVSNAESRQAEAADRAAKAIREEERALNQKKNATSGATAVTEQNTKAQERNNSTVVKAAKQVFTYGTVLSAFRRIYSTVTNTVKEMDKALTGMAVVTNMTREQTWQLVGTFQDLANQTGKTTSEIANMATKFFQQGKSLTQVKQLTEAAAKAATIAGIDGSTSINLLTNAMNGFQMSASKAMEVSDKFAALAASAATDYEELATALSKVAAQANLAGMSMDFTLGMLTKGIEVTREAPETIGTALKTVIARMRELTDYGATLEDGVDVNRVAKALANIDVQLMDQNGQFRDLEQVLTEVGSKWDTLNKNQQANVAVALAGTRQQSRLIAMMQDFDRTLELVDISANSYGATLSQSAKYMGGMEAAGARLKTAMEGLVTSVVQSDAIIVVMDAIQGILGAVTTIVSQTWLLVPVLVLLGGYLLGQLNIKMADMKINRENLKQQKLQNKTKLDQLITEKKTALEALKTKKTELEKLKVSKQNLITNLENLKVKAQERGNLDLVNKCNEKITAAKQEIAKYDAEIATTTTQITASQKELTLLEEKKAETQFQSVGLLSGIFNVLSTIFTIGVSLITVIGTIFTLYKKINKEKIKSIKNTLQEAAAAKIAAAKEKIKAAWSMAGSAGSIPVVGWVIAGAILAALIGTVIAGLVAAGKKTSSGEKAEESIAKTREELNQLQADLYNLKSAQQTVAKLGDEFENLSNKIVQSSEDIERMNEIAQQINDTAGRTVVDTTADAATQLRQIRAYNIQQKNAVKAQTEKINDKLGQGLTDAQNAGIFNTKKTRETAKNKYYQSLKTDAAFVNSIRTVGMANLTGMDSVSAAASDAMLDIMVDNIDSGAYFSEDGVDTGKFEQYITDALASSGYSGGYSAFLAQLDSVAEDGSMTAYANMLDDLGKSGDKNFKKLIDSLKKSNPMFAAVAKMGAETARKFDAIGFSSDDLNVMWEKLGQSSKVLGKDAGETFAEMAKNIEAMGDTDGDGVVSDLEARQAMYKQLVAEQLASAEASKAILDGTDQTSEAALAYKKNCDDLTETQEDIIDKQKEIDKENDKSNPDEDKLEDLQEDMDSLTNKEADLKDKTDAVTNAAKDCYANIEDLKTILGMVEAKAIAEELTKLSSAMERLTKVSDVASMSLTEQLDLLSDYPGLLAAVERGYITASEAAAVYGESIAKSLDDIQANKSNYELIYSKSGGSKLSTADMGGFENLFADTEEGKQLRAEFLKAGIFDKNDAIARKLWSDDNIKAKFDNNEAEFIKYLNGMRADVQDFEKQDLLASKLEQGDYRAIMSADDQKKWDTATSEVKQRRNLLDTLNEELENAIEDSPEYQQILKRRNDLILQTLKDGKDRIAQIKEETKELLKVDPDDENYGDLIELAGGDDALDEYVKYVNGVAEINYEELNKLSEAQKGKLLPYLSTVIGSLNNLAEEEKDLTDQIREDQEILAQSIIDAEVKILEAQIENLEKRKEAYEKYFDEVDKMEEERDRTATMNDIAKQLSALSGGHDASTNALRKELMSQMNDLREEEENARKEAAREALLEDIDNQIDALNTQMEKVNESLKALIKALDEAKDPTKIVVGTDADGHPTLTVNGVNALPFEEGGLVDYTGPAIVHGSPSSPEAFLSAQDTKNMQLLFAVLNDVVAKSSSINADTANGANNITIDNINIQTNELNNNQDFRTAGQIFAEEFGKAIKQRGLNINVRK